MISQKTRSSLTVTIATLLIVFGTLLLVAFASGYNIDFLHGEITTTGLALLNTNPSGASIRVNNKLLTQKTPYRLEGLKTGSIIVEYNKTDYHNWKTNYFVKGGEVTFADYALLIPNNIITRENESKTAFGVINSSEDKTKAFALANTPASIYEIRENEQIHKIADVPNDNSIKPAISQQLITISTDGNALIIKASYESGNSITYWVNTTNGEIVNLTAFVPPTFEQLKINPRNTHEILALSGGTINRISTDTRTITPSGTSNVTSYNLDVDNIYSLENLAPAANGQFLVRYDLQVNNRFVIAQYDPSQKPWTIGLSKLHGQTNISLHNPIDNALHIVRQQDGKILTSLVGAGVSLPSFSTNGRFISYMQSSKFKTIDLEFAERFSSEIPGVNNIQWFTDFQLLLTRPDGLYIVDFTGENLIKIPPNTATNEATLFALDKNGKHVYYLSNSKLNSYTLEPKGGLINFR